MTKAREAKKTVQCVDTYSELYKDIFPEVRAYEAFKYLMVGMLSDIKRKSLPAISVQDKTLETLTGQYFEFQRLRYLRCKAFKAIFAANKHFLSCT